MQRSNAYKTFLFILMILLLTAGSALAATPGKKPADGPAKLSLAEAKALVNEKVFNNQLSEVYLHEIVNDDLWKRMQVQVYEEGLMISDNRILLLCQEPQFVFGKTVCVSDLNQDGRPELIYFYSTANASAFYDFIGIFANGMILEEIPVAKGDLNHVISIKKIDDQNVQVTLSNESPPLYTQPEAIEKRDVRLHCVGLQFLLEF